MPVPRPRRAAVLLVVAIALVGCREQPEPREPREASTRAGPAEPAGPSPATGQPARPPFELEPFEPGGRGGWLTEIPDGVPLDVALPVDDGDVARRRTGIGFRFCDVEGFTTDGALDRATVSASGPEYGESRDLRVFASDRAAHRFLRHVVTVVRTCPEQETGGTTWRHELRPSHLVGDASFTAVQSFFTQDDLPVLGANFWEVVRVGNAVLLTATGGEYDPTSDLGTGIRRHATDVVPVVAAMCVFAAAPCRGQDIAAGFPLAAGWPDDEEAEPGKGYGLTPPTRRLPPMRFAACGERLVLDGATDRLGSRWRNVEDYRARQLTTYATADAAVAAVAALVALHRACATEEGADDGYTTIVDVLRQEVGGASWAIVHRSELEGAPAVGLGVHLVVRLGRSVLVDEAWNERGAGHDPDADVRSQIRRQLDTTSEVVTAMCAFTAAGCPTSP